jgi:predicted nucleotidyltransferase
VELRRLEGEELERTLAALVQAIVASLDPERILLFGSLARGDQNRASDIDLVVVARTELPFLERIGRVLEACHPVSPLRAVEPLVYTPEEWQRMLADGGSFAHHVEREARVLHERGSKLGGGPPLAAPGAARS